MSILKMTVLEVAYKAEILVLQIIMTMALGRSVFLMEASVLKTFMMMGVDKFVLLLVKHVQLISRTMVQEIDALEKLKFAQQVIEMQEMVLVLLSDNLAQQNIEMTVLD